MYFAGLLSAFYTDQTRIGEKGKNPLFSLSQQKSSREPTHCLYIQKIQSKSFDWLKTMVKIVRLVKNKRKKTSSHVHIPSYSRHEKRIIQLESPQNTNFNIECRTKTIFKYFQIGIL